MTYIDAVRAGATFSLALGIDGRAWTWGLNDVGQLGDGTNTNSTTPVEVTNITKISAVACGSDHRLAIRNGKVKSWGLNDAGQLGDGTNTSSKTPKTIDLNLGWTAVEGPGECETDDIEADPKKLKLKLWKKHRSNININCRRWLPV